MPTETEMHRQAQLYTQAANLAIKLHQHCLSHNAIPEKKRLCHTAIKASLRAERRWARCVCLLAAQAKNGFL